MNLWLINTDVKYSGDFNEYHTILLDRYMVDGTQYGYLRYILAGFDEYIRSENI